MKYYTYPVHNIQKSYDRKLAPQSVGPMSQGCVGFCLPKSGICTGLRKCHEWQWSSTCISTRQQNHPHRKQLCDMSKSREGGLATQCGIASPNRLVSVSLEDTRVFSETIRDSELCIFQCVAITIKFVEVSPWISSTSCLIHWGLLLSFILLPRAWVSVLLGSSVFTEVGSTSLKVF